MCLSLWDESDGWFFGQITNNAMHYCALLRDLGERVRSWDENASMVGMGFVHELIIDYMQIQFCVARLHCLIYKLFLLRLLIQHCIRKKKEKKEKKKTQTNYILYTISEKKFFCSCKTRFL